MDSDAARARFLTAISHDMRQPLQALMLYLNALERRVPEGEARAVLAKADHAAQALVSMFNNLIDLARIETGKVQPEFGSVSLKDLFDTALEREPRAATDTTTLYVKSDPVLLDQILRQLVSNAMRHGGGSARLSATNRDGAVELAVGDAGPGIAAEHHSRIFEEFERLEGAAADGLGLGLTIVRKLSDLLGHEIEVRSAPGQGATFIVRAPRA
ncbi:MAG: sensor histidine kinase [Caulobacteraceae bacterium]